MVTGVNILHYSQKNIWEKFHTETKHIVGKSCNFPHIEVEVEIANEIDAKKFSCWFKLINVSAQVLISGYKMTQLFENYIYAQYFTRTL